MSEPTRSAASADIPPGPRGPVQGSGTADWRGSFRRESFAGDWDFVRRVVIAIALFGLAYFLWSIGRVLLLVFAAALVAVLLHALANLIARRTPIPDRWGLAAAVVVVAIVLIAFLTLFGSHVAGQTGQLLDQLPQATQAIAQRLGMPDAAERLQQAIGAGAGQNILSQVAGMGFTVLGGLGDLVVVIVAAIYLAADPGLYRRGSAKLLPPSQHERVHDALGLTGTALKLWSAGQLLAMTVVGTLSALAFWWIGLPAPLSLGIIAGVMDFIPFLGPLLGAIPAVIFASTISVDALIWTLAAVLVIQQIEGNVLMPLIQRHQVSLPPALGLFAILVFGVLFGFLGVFLAVPLAVALMVLVKQLWIRETLGEDTTLPGEDKK